MRSEPRPGLGGEAAHHAAYLDFYRRSCIEKCRSLPATGLRTSRLPSGWTPIELLQHLAFMERRWFVWGFLGEQVEEPWGDSQGDGEARWAVAQSTALDDVVRRLEEGAARVNDVLTAHDLDEIASTGGRFADADPPDLRWICFHVLQEYARHAGHLDVAVELCGGPTGE